MKLNILAFDTEMASTSLGMPSPDRDPITIISVAYFLNNKLEYKLFVISDEDFANNDDSKIIQQFIDFIKLGDFDLITTFNGDAFDWRYIQKRCDIHKIPLNIGRDESVVTIRDEGKNLPTVNIVGRLNVDLYKLAKRELQEVKVKKLENVAEYLGVIKKSRRTNLTPKEITSCWHSNRKLLYKYARDDVVSTLKIAMKMLPAQINLSNLIGAPLDELCNLGRGRQVENYLTYKFYDENELMPYKRGEETTFEGAFVLKPTKGVYTCVGDIDFKSLYPAIIIKNNISPDTYIETYDNEEDVNIAPEVGHAFRKYPDGIYKRIMTSLLEERKKIQDRMNTIKRTSNEYKLLDLQQYNFKVLSNCFSEDTDVLTPDGIKNIREFEIGDRVYTLNPSSRNIEISNVVDVITSESEHLYEIDGDGYSFRVTPNHNMFLSGDYSTKPRFIEAQDISHLKRLWFPLHNPLEGHRPKYFSLWDYVEDDDIIFFKANERACHRFEVTKNNIFTYVRSTRAHRVKKRDVGNPHDFEERYKGKLFLKSYKTSSLRSWKYNIKDFMELCGWYVSEGSLYFRKSEKNKHRSGFPFPGESYYITITQKKHVDKLRVLFDKLDLPVSIYTNKNGVTNFRVCDKFIHRALKDLFGEISRTKFIHHKIFDYDYSILKHLYKSMMYGDGDEVQRYSTMSKRLAGDMLILGFLLGNTGKTQKEKDRIYRTHIYRSKKHSIKSNKNIKQINWKNTVYCITTDKNHIIFAGRKGKFQWTGQSFWGFVGWPASKLFNIACAEAITAWGRYYIKKAHKIAEDNGFNVLFSDTDSAFISKDDITDIELLKRETETLVTKIQSQLGLDIKADEYFKSILFTGKKKRYSAINEFDERVDRGLEVRRGDWSLLSQEMQSQILDIVLRENNPPKALHYANNIIKDLHNGNIEPEKLVIWKTLTREITDYQSKQPHVIAAKRALSSPSRIKYAVGSKVPYVIFRGTGKVSDRAFPFDVIDEIDGNSFSTEGIKFDIDKNYYEDKQIRSAALRILEVFGYNRDDLGSTKETKLEL